VIVSMLLYSFPKIKSLDFDSFTIKSITTDF
jgi:hypothetical protein